MVDKQEEQGGLRVVLDRVRSPRLVQRDVWLLARALALAVVERGDGDAAANEDERRQE